MLIRLLFLQLIVLFATAGSAAPVQLVFPESTYTPGTPFKFSVEMPAATNLGSFQIDILMTGSTGEALRDFSVDLEETGAATNRFVFPSDVNFFDSTNLDSPMAQRLTLTDIDFGGVNVVPGINDAVADVVISTLPSFIGDLTFSVDASALILDTPDFTPTPINEFAAIQADTLAISARTITAFAIPEPSSAILLTFAGSAFVTSRRRRSRR